MRSGAGWLSGLLLMLALPVLSPAQPRMELVRLWDDFLPARIDSLAPGEAKQGEQVTIRVFGSNLVRVREAEFAVLKRAVLADTGPVPEPPPTRKRITALTELRLGDIVSGSMYVRDGYPEAVVTIPADAPPGFKDVSVVLNGKVLAGRPDGFKVSVLSRPILRLSDPLATVIAAGDSLLAGVTVWNNSKVEARSASVQVRLGADAGRALEAGPLNAEERRSLSWTLALAGVLPGIGDSVVFELLPPAGSPGEAGHRVAVSFERPGRPDLAVTILPVPQSNAAELVVAVKVENLGSGTAGSSTVRVSADNPALEQVNGSVTGLRPGQATTDSFRFAIPEAARGRTTRLTAYVSPVPGETDTANNRHIAGIDLMAGAIPPVVDTGTGDSAGTGATPGPTQEPEEEERERSGLSPIVILLVAGGAAGAALAGWLVFRMVQAGAGRGVPGRTPAPGEKSQPDANRAGTGPGSLPPGAAGVRDRDDVLFSVTAPGEVTARDPFLVNVWAHLDAQRDEVLARARQAQPDSRVSIQSEGPFAIERNTELELVLTVQDCTVEPPAKRIRWTGAIANAGFLVRFGEGAAEGVKAGRVSVLWRGVEIACVPFTFRLVAALSGADPAEAVGRVHRKAFASYTRRDAAEVLTCIQGMKKVVPGLEVFVDVLDLRSGEYWGSRLQQEILASDVLYLFWSRAAAESEWVDREWRFGLERRGLDFIDPVPLVPEREAPAPPELKAKHFDDKLVYVRQGFKPGRTT